MDIKKELIDIVKDYTDVPTDALDGTSPLKSLGLNSYVVMSMIAEIENHFGISIPDSELYSFKSLNDILDFISQNFRKSV